MNVVNILLYSLQGNFIFFSWDSLPDIFLILLFKKLTNIYPMSINIAFNCNKTPLFM